jgi:hypothetical protein
MVAVGYFSQTDTAKPKHLGRISELKGGLEGKTQTNLTPLDPSSKPTSQRCIAEGDTVVVYERHDAMRAGGMLQNRFGVFRHDDWIGRPFGCKVHSAATAGGKGKGGFIHLLAPTSELWTLMLSHRTQILYLADISLVVSYLELVPGCHVLESGSGCGSLTMSLFDQENRGEADIRGPHRVIWSFLIVSLSVFTGNNKIMYPVSSS